MEEEKRLKELIDFEVLDTLPEIEFDEIVELASTLCATPVSLITLLDSNRQWLKAKTGIEMGDIPREFSFCHYAIQKPQEIMVINDTLEDSRFKNNPITQAARFYAGAPLITASGYALGTLCVLDSQPREFSDEQQRVLKILASTVMKYLELRKENLKKKQQLELTLSRLLEAQQIASIGSWDWNIADDDLYWSPEMYRIFGLDESASQQISFTKWGEMIHSDDLPFVLKSKADLMNTGVPGKVEYRIITANGEKLWLLQMGTVFMDENNKPARLKGTALDITERKIAEENKQQYTKTLEEMLFDFSHKVRKPVAAFLGLGNLLNLEPNLSHEKILQYAEYFKVSALELDAYIHEMTDSLHEKKIILGKKLTE
jgi:PAS domain S-box-containing protein